jgi:16S rRNA (uracil1498-N3)-methyltransferase
LHVLRLRQGERVVILDGAGHEFLCEARELAHDTVKLGVMQKNFIPPLPYQITLVQAIPKGKIIESIIQKATELGAARVVPLLSERVVAHLDEGASEDKAEKWRSIAVEAIKQCGSPWLPEIETPISPKAFLARGEKFDLPLIASLQPDSKHPRELFKRFYAERGRLPQSVCVWVGPEGDFTPAEVSAAKSAGAVPITLGRLVLRSETAAIYCLSVLNYELQANGNGNG